MDLIALNYAVTIAALLTLAIGLWTSNSESDDRMVAVVLVLALVPGLNLALLGYMVWCLLRELWRSLRRKAKARRQRARP